MIELAVAEGDADPSKDVWYVAAGVVRWAIDRLTVPWWVRPDPRGS